MALAGPPPPEAGEEGRAQWAEARRLRQEIATAARSSRHDAVERLYRQLLEVPEPIPADMHGLAADAARSKGDVLRAVARLHRAGDEEALADLSSRFGAVRFSVPSGSELSGPTPFAPDEVASLAWTRAQLAGSGMHLGLVPVGIYTVAGQEVVVDAGSLTTVVASLAPAVADPAGP